MDEITFTLTGQAARLVAEMITGDALVSSPSHFAPHVNPARVALDINRQTGLMPEMASSLEGVAYRFDCANGEY